jgi:hypothetical protein
MMCEDIYVASGSAYTAASGLAGCGRVTRMSVVREQTETAVV